MGEGFLPGGAVGVQTGRKRNVAKASVWRWSDTVVPFCSVLSGTLTKAAPVSALLLRDPRRHRKDEGLGEGEGGCVCPTGRRGRAGHYWITCLVLLNQLW